MVRLIAKSLIIFLLSVVKRQRRCHAKFHDLVHEMILREHLMMDTFIAYFWKGGNFLESNRAKWPRKQAFFHCRTVKGTESNNFKCKGRSMYSLIHEQWKRQIPKLSRANCVTIQLTVRAWSHEPGKQCAWAVCYSLSCFSLGSFAGPPGKRDYLENFHPGSRHHYTGIPANRAGSVVM